MEHACALSKILETNAERKFQAARSTWRINLVELIQNPAGIAFVCDVVYRNLRFNIAIIGSLHPVASRDIDQGIAWDHQFRPVLSVAIRFTDVAPVFTKVMRVSIQH